MRHDRDGWSIEAAKAKGRPLPDWYLERPVSEPGDAWFLQAWHDLSTCRSVGMDLGPIPWDRIVAYAQWHALDPHMTEVLIVVVRQMDEAYRAWHRDEAERKRKTSNGKQPGDTKA